MFFKIYSTLLTLLIIGGGYFAFENLYLPVSDILTKKDVLAETEKKIIECKGLYKKNKKILDENRECKLDLKKSKKILSFMEKDFEILMKENRENKIKIPNFQKEDSEEDFEILDEDFEISDEDFEKENYNQKEDVVLGFLDLNQKIEFNTLSFAKNNNFGEKDLAFIKGSSIPDLKSLYKNTKNKALKASIKKHCEESFIDDGKNPSFKEKIKNVLSLYCKGGISKNCKGEDKKRIDNIKSSIQTKGFQLLTKYEKGNPGKFTERLLSFYDNFGNKICIIKGMKKDGKETYDGL